MTDLLSALAERLRRTFAVWRDHAYVDLQSLDVDGFTLVVDDRDAADVLAREALAFVAERLPANVLTSEDHAAIQLVIHDQADNRPSSISLTGTLLGIVDRLDALLHDLRGRLGGKS